MKRLLKIIAPKSFNDGLARCNNLGKSLIFKREINKFLDIGCGDGSLSLEFATVAKSKEIYGVEIVDEFRREAESKGVICSKFDLNKKWIYKDNFFDLVLSSQNIEHMHDTRIYIEECYRCMKAGGQLIILTENLASWDNIWALIFGWQPFSTTNINDWSIGNPLIWHVDEPKDERFLKKCRNAGINSAESHIRVLAFRGLKDLLKKAGFKDVKIYTKGYLPLWGKVSDLLCRIDKKHGRFLIATGFKY